MESKVNYLRVGIFLLAMSVVTVGLLFWLGHALDSEGDTYIVFFEKQSLDGLQKDSPVTMKGIKVGSVKNYEISASNIQQVKVILVLDVLTPIKIDTKAVLRRNLLTGLAKIDLVGGTQESAILRTREGEAFPVIPEELTQLDKLADTLPDLLSQVREIAGRINTVLSDQNLGNIKTTLDNFTNVSNDLSKAGPSLSKAATSVEMLSSRAVTFIEKFTTDSHGKEGTLEKADKVLLELQLLAKDLRTLSTQIGSDTLGFSRAASSIERDLKEISIGVSSLAERYQSPSDLFNPIDSNIEQQKKND